MALRLAGQAPFTAISDFVSPQNRSRRISDSGKYAASAVAQGVVSQVQPHAVQVGLRTAVSQRPVPREPGSRFQLGSDGWNGNSVQASIGK